MTDKKVTIEITKEACDLLRSFLMNDREGTGEGYSDFILKAIDVRRQVAALQAENAALRATLQQIAAGNPASPGKWLSDIEMADIARYILSKVEGRVLGEGS